MINYLYDVSASTPISQLPAIINHNNTTVRKEFDYIFESSTNKLIRSVYAPTGFVKTHIGEFVNLTCDYINVKNASSLIGTVRQAVSGLVFDSSVVTYGVEHLPLDRCLHGLIDNVSTLLTATGLSTVASSNDNEEPGTYGVTRSVDDVQQSFVTYDETVLYATTAQLKRKKIPALHKSDIQNGNIFNYYTVVGDSVTVSNEHPISLQGISVGQVVDITFNQADTTKDFYFILDRSTGTYLQMTYDELNCLQLKAVSVDDKEGTVWKLYGYSVTNPSYIKKIKI